MGNSGVVRCQVAPSLDSLDELMGFVDRFVAARGWPDAVGQRMLTNIELVVEEIFVNAVRYGHPGLDSTIDVELEAVDATQAQLTMRDGGDAYNPFVEAPRPDVTADVEARPVGGLGVFLVKSLTSQYRYSREGRLNVISCTFDATHCES